MLFLTASIFVSGCVTQSVWSELDHKKYTTLAKDSLPENEYARLTTDERLENQDTIVLPGGHLHVRKSRLSHVAIDAGKVLALPVTIPADILVGVGIMLSDPDVWMNTIFPLLR